MLEFTTDYDSHYVSQGSYVITDLCYLFGEHNNGLPDEMWQKMCSEIFCHRSSGTIIIDDFKIWWGLTAFGDGIYTVRQAGMRNKRFGVDAGLFAIIPYEFIKKHVPAFKVKRGLAAKVQLNGGRVRYDEGNITCDNIVVITGDDEHDPGY